MRFQNGFYFLNLDKCKSLDSFKLSSKNVSRQAAALVANIPCQAAYIRIIGSAKPELKNNNKMNISNAFILMITRFL